MPLWWHVPLQWLQWPLLLFVWERREDIHTSMAERVDCGPFCLRRCLPPSLCLCLRSSLSAPMYSQDCISSLLVPERGRPVRSFPAIFFCPCLPMSPRKPYFFTPGDDHPTRLGDLAPLEAPKSLSVRTQGVDLSWVIRELDHAPLVSGSPGNTVAATVFGAVTSVMVTSEVPSKEPEKATEKADTLGQKRSQSGAGQGVPSAECSAHGRHGSWAWRRSGPPSPPHLGVTSSGRLWAPAQKRRDRNLS